MRQARAAAFCCLVWVAAFALPVQAVPSELIILLPAGADPLGVADLINQGGGNIPYGLSLGNPLRASLAFGPRPEGRTLAFIEANPDEPLAKLHRYLLLEYPTPTDVRAVQDTLEADGQLPSVELNLDFELSASTVAPNDPFFGTLLGDPNYSQWASHLMRFPAAWALASGHAQVGIVDQGIQVDHPELLDYLKTGPAGPWLYLGGNVRTQRSFSVALPPVSVQSDRCRYDERDNSDFWAGHGTHVAGLIGARANNSAGVAGTCWNCSLMIAKAFENQATPRAAIEAAGDSALNLVAQGAQLLNFSFGIKRSDYPDCTVDPDASMCRLLQLIAQRHVVVAAAAGNDRVAIEFPASEPMVIAIGGLQRTLDPPYFQYWDEGPSCPRPDGEECGANVGSTLDLAAPAKSVLSTLYTNWNHNPELACGDRPDMPGIANDGLGVCTGTSMATPLVAGLAAIVRSVNPWLNNLEVADAMTSTATHANAHTNALGYGLPRADVAVVRGLGTVAAETLKNRLTPMIGMRSLTAAQVHFFTPAPQEASALTLDSFDPFDTFGPEVPGYSLPGACSGGGICPPNPPKASFFTWTTSTPLSDGQSLVPLYRLRYDPRQAATCADRSLPPLSNRRFAYALNNAELDHFRNTASDGFGTGYEVDGILGWVHPWCEPNLSCRPPGTVALYRFYKAATDDWALVVEADRTQYHEDGYGNSASIFPGVGFVYPNVDTDNDLLIDGWERILGTNPQNIDSDCDGILDGVEVRTYRSTGPPSEHGYRDPLAGPCQLFFHDGFETGDTSRWSATVFLDDGIGF